VNGPVTIAVYFSGTLQQYYQDQYPMGASGTPPPTPPTPLVLKTNGTLNPVQSILNLIAGQNVVLTADGSGDVTVDSPQTVLIGSDGAFFFGPGITDAGLVYGGETWNAVALNLANNAITANQVVVYLFELFDSFTISKASMLATNNAGGVYATCGIYDHLGNKVVDAGSFLASTGAGVQTNNVNGGTPVTLKPGLYWHAQAAPNTSAGATFLPGITLTSSASGIMGVFLNNSPRVAIAANPLVGGVLPATLGTLIPFTPSISHGDGVAAPLYE